MLKLQYKHTKYKEIRKFREWCIKQDFCFIDQIIGAAKLYNLKPQQLANTLHISLEHLSQWLRFELPIEQRTNLDSQLKAFQCNVLQTKHELIKENALKQLNLATEKLKNADKLNTRHDKALAEGAYNSTNNSNSKLSQSSSATAKDNLSALTRVKFTLSSAIIREILLEKPCSSAVTSTVPVSRKSPKSGPDNSFHLYSDSSSDMESAERNETSSIRANSPHSSTAALPIPSPYKFPSFLDQFLHNSGLNLLNSPISREIQLREEEELSSLFPQGAEKALSSCSHSNNNQFATPARRRQPLSRLEPETLNNYNNINIFSAERMTMSGEEGGSNNNSDGTAASLALPSFSTPTRAQFEAFNSVAAQPVPQQLAFVLSPRSGLASSILNNNHGTGTNNNNIIEAAERASASNSLRRSMR
jgi:hypothetical protein